MTTVFSLKLRYLCAQCGYQSPRLKVAPSGLCTEARLPAFHPHLRKFELLRVRMTLGEAVAHLAKLETVLADRQWNIDKKMEPIAQRRFKLVKALHDGHGHPQLKAGILTLNRQLASYEHDKIRQARLLSQDLGDLAGHISRLRENALEAFDDGLASNSILLWPRPWTQGKKVSSVPCPSCVVGVAREHLEGI